MNPVKSAALRTHRRPGVTARALRALISVAAERGVTLRFDPEETAKHHLSPAPGLILDAPPDAAVDICFALGGDGTILNALRTYAGTEVPVFAVNFGEMGFLATVDREDARSGILRALDGEYEVLSLPAIQLSSHEGDWLAINDVSIHRQQGKRVADLEYAVGGNEVGRVRCDGLVVATPAGSTGYNLANGGPVMAWGVHGYVVSFIAPHSLTARTLVVAPDDELTVHNRSHEEAVDITVDGRPIGAIEAGDRVQARFVNDLGRLAQVPGTTFYQRLRQKFGRLATPL
ncbi:MAG: NAD(+)/NADH kinase [Actinomycetota bacterium]|nr:NAD(+)/NADH kinase [Actinomycetota bacterium]